MKNAWIQFAWRTAWDSELIETTEVTIYFSVQKQTLTVPQRIHKIWRKNVIFIFIYLLFTLTDNRYTTKYDSIKINSLWLWKTY